MTYQEALQARARIAYSKNALTKVAIKINKKDLFAFLRQSYAKVDGRGRFAHAAFLVGDRNGCYTQWGITSLSNKNTRWRTPQGLMQEW